MRVVRVSQGVRGGHNHLGAAQPGMAAVTACQQVQITTSQLPAEPDCLCGLLTICSAASKHSLRSKGHTDNRQGCRNVNQSLSFPLLVHSRQLATVLRVMSRPRGCGSPVLIYLDLPLI